MVILIFVFISITIMLVNTDCHNICDVYMMYRKHGNMKTMVQMLLVVLGLFCCSHVSQAIKCHQCTTLVPNAKCSEDEFDPKKHKETCTDDREDAVCFKNKIRRHGQLMIYLCDNFVEIMATNLNSRNSRNTVTLLICVL